MGRAVPRDPVDALVGLERFGIKPGLATINELTAASGKPQAAYRSITVAGSNGKGSVVAMIDSALRAAGYRVGRYTSPHLTALAERFVVDGNQISERELRIEAEQLHHQVNRLVSDGRLSEPPTFFEATTAMALSWFRQAGVELALLEVGLGGRFDATNIVTPVAGVITPITLEHCQYLGDTVEAIAREKAGIVKAGMVVVTTETTPAIVALLEQACDQNGARLVQAIQGTTVEISSTENPRAIQVTTPTRTYPSFEMGLSGAHQISNGIGAIRLLEELPELGIPVDIDAVVKGLSTVVWPGRLERVEITGRGTALLDAAHNPAAAAALANYLREAFPSGLPLVLAVMNDKDIDGIVRQLAPSATHIVCTAPDNPRAVPAEVLAERVRQTTGTPVVTACQDPQCAMEAAWDQSQTICVTGSIFLVGELLTMLQFRRSTPD